MKAGLHFTMSVWSEWRNCNSYVEFCLQNSSKKGTSALTRTLALDNLILLDGLFEPSQEGGL
jgi:hypothetical protein